jgi:hypothetical protein
MRYVQGRAAEVSVGVANRLDLRVRTSDLTVVALADGLVVKRNHRSDQRVWADATAARFGDLHRASEQPAIRIGSQRHGLIRA